MIAVGGPAGVRRRPAAPGTDPGGEGRTLRLALATAAVGSVGILLGSLGLLVGLIGLGLAALGSLIAAAAAPPAGWWNLMAVGVALAVVALPVGLASNVAAGLLEVAGGVLVLAGVAGGYPRADGDGRRP